MCAARNLVVQTSGAGPRAARVERYGSSCELHPTGTVDLLTGTWKCFRRYHHGPRSDAGSRSFQYKPLADFSEDLRSFLMRAGLRFSL